jgi:hypothetical protein
MVLIDLRNPCDTVGFGKGEMTDTARHRPRGFGRSRMTEAPAQRPHDVDGASSVWAAAAGDEAVVDIVEGLGASLVVTRTRVIVVRQGAHFRPRSGIRAWPYAALRDVQLAPPRNGDGRIVLRTGPYPWHAVNLFVSGHQWAAVERVVAQIRARATQAKRAPTRKQPTERHRLVSDSPDRD